MRVIKFRAWNYGSFTYIGSNYDLPYWSCSGAKDEESTLSEMKWEQFTGLTDKNGVDIYEGDIVKRQYDFDEDDDFTVYKVVFSVLGYSSTMGFHCIEENETLYDFYGGMPCADELTVIGSIHQNPELLESKR